MVIASFVDPNTLLMILTRFMGPLLLSSAGITKATRNVFSVTAGIDPVSSVGTSTEKLALGGSVGAMSVIKWSIMMQEYLV